MCIFLLAPLIFGYAPEGIGIGEPDIWWRLRSAADLLRFHTLSRVDTYSFTAAGLPWTNFEWLSDLWFLLAFRTMGLQGLVIVYSSVMMLIFVGVYYRSLRAGADCKDAALATLVGICLARIWLAPRPVLFGWLCLTGLLLVLDHFRRTGNALWLLPPLFIIWVNLHGSWIYGIAILTLTIAAGLVQGNWGLVVSNRWRPAELRKLLLVLGASIAALFVNPFGYKMVVFPLSFYRMSGFMKYSQYWHSVDFGTFYGKMVLVSIVMLFAAALLSRRSWRLDEVLLIAFALWSGLSHVRFMDFAAIIIVPILAPHLKLLPPYEPNLDKPWLNAGVMAAIIAWIVFSFPSENQLQKKLDGQYPASALEYMQQHQINGRIFNPDEFGGFIEWKAPDLKSFVDGREVFVRNGVFDDSMRALLIQRPFEVLEKYHVDYVLIRPNRPLGYLLQHSPYWRLLYHDKVAALFERRRTEFAPSTVQ